MTENVELEEIRFSNTSLNYHRKCPQMWAYDQVRRLEKDTGEVSAPLDFGNWWHAIRAAELIDEGRRRGTLRYCPPTLKTAVEEYEIPTDVEEPLTLVDVVWTEIDAWWENLSPGHKDLWVEQLGEAAPDRLRYVDARWWEQWGKVTANEDPIAVEMPWTKLLPTMKIGDEVLKATQPLNGVIDALVYDKRRGMLIMRDTKSHKTISSYSQVDEMLDSQLQIYAWAATEEVKKWELGPLRAIQYDRVCMTAPRTPELTAAGNLSKSVTLYDAHTYRQWAHEDTRPTHFEIEELCIEKHPDDKKAQLDMADRILDVLHEPGRVWGKVGEWYVSGAKKGEPKFGLYEPDPKVYEELRTPDAVHTWLHRTLSPVNRNIVLTHLRSAVDTTIAAEQTYRRFIATGSAPRNFGQACRFCPFSALCKVELVGGASGEYDLAEMGLRKKAPNDPR